MRTLIFLVMSFNAFAFAGGTGSSGGGGAYVCRDKTSPSIIQDAELVDLWEARILDGRPIVYRTENYWQQAREKIERFREVDIGIYRRMVASLKFMENNFYPLPAGVSIPAPSDIGHAYEKQGCPLEGMMYFDGKRGRLAVRLEVFEKLQSETDRAAAIFHEVIYKVLRETTRVQTTSGPARELTGCLFSMKADDCLNVSPALDRVPKDVDAYACQRGPLTKFYVWKDSAGVHFVINQLSGVFIPAGLYAYTRHAGFDAQLKHLGFPLLDQFFGKLNMRSWQESGLSFTVSSAFGEEHSVSERTPACELVR